MPHVLRLALLTVLLTLPALAQVERINDAALLFRAASFYATINTPTTYVLTEYTPGRWIAHAQDTPPSSLNWAVKDAPMMGANAGYVVFVNGENETMTIDVLMIDECYGTTGRLRNGW